MAKHVLARDSLPAPTRKFIQKGRQQLTTSLTHSTMASGKEPDYIEQRDLAMYPSTPSPPAKMSATHYLSTRLSSLKPPMDRVENPFALLASLTRMNWLMFLCAFAAWTWDAFDFFTVSLTITQIGATFNESTKAVTWGITLVLMFRSVGAIIFGIAADRYGRKWPFVVNNVLFIVLELGTGFCQTYKQFLACRALFGVAMGGIYGQDSLLTYDGRLLTGDRQLRSDRHRGRAAQSARNCLRDAAARLRLWIPSRHSLRPRPRRHDTTRLAPTFLVRCLPARPFHLVPSLPAGDGQLHRAPAGARRRAQRGQDVHQRGQGGAAAALDAVGVPCPAHGGLQLHVPWLAGSVPDYAYESVWLLEEWGDGYAVSLAPRPQIHGSPHHRTPLCCRSRRYTLFKIHTFVEIVTLADSATHHFRVVANLGAMLGGTVIGYLSQMFGRRFSIIVISILGGALLYPYGFVGSNAVIAAAFFEQFCVQGAWGVIRERIPFTSLARVFR